MPVTRNIHWATRELNDYLRSHAETPFVWGEHDCCLFPANAIQAFTGTDLAADFRGKYTDETTAFAAIHSITGGSTVEDAAAWVAAKFGLPEWTKPDGSPAPLLAKRGDLVVLPNPLNLPATDPARFIAGIVSLTGRTVLAVAEGGLVQFPLQTAVRAWRIG